jgi:hypothetical protein
MLYYCLLLFAHNFLWEGPPLAFLGQKEGEKQQHRYYRNLIFFIYFIIHFFIYTDIFFFTLNWLVK